MVNRQAGMERGQTGLELYFFGKGLFQVEKLRTECSCRRIFYSSFVL